MGISARLGRTVLVSAASLLLASVACRETATSSAVQRPTPVQPGSPIEGTSPATGSVGPPGGTLSTPDGLLTINVPPGALSAAAQFSIQAISNTAPRGIGNAYRLSAGGVTFNAPVAITFRTNVFPNPAESLTVAYQDGSGYWVPVLSSLRNKSAGLITVTTLHFSDWALVPSDSTLDMAGQFTVTSTLDAPAPFTAVGTAAMAYVGANTAERMYLFSGSTTLQPPTVAGQVCTAAAPTYSFPTNVAEVFTNPANFEWGTSGIWDVSCGGTPTRLIAVFDTAGISHIGCARGYTSGIAAPVATEDTLTGDYTIDCSAQGRGQIRASWAFQRCGGTCTSTNTCATSATYSCASGAPVCTVLTSATAGTACTLATGGSGVCDVTGTCIACAAGASCTPTTACGATAIIVCSSGAEVCTDQTYKSAGTACTDTIGQPGVCSGTSSDCVQCTQGASCTPSGPCISSATIDCSGGGPACKDGAPKAAGTACTTVSGAAGVCDGSAASCVQCTQGAACTPSGACITSASIDCSTGAPVCVDGTPVPAGSACIGIPGAVCSGPPANQCNLCTQGASCSPSGPCVVGASIDCTTGSAVCKDGLLLSAGIGCTTTTGAPGVCNGSSSTCIACTQGASCPPSGPCITTASIDCSSGTAVCIDGAGFPAGTACTTSGGAAGVCSGPTSNPPDACGACTAGEACSSTNPCATAAAISCSSGAPVCTDTTFQADATQCGSSSGGVCISGACVACTAGTACVPANPCHVGTLSCGDATTPPACVDTGVPVADGQACTTVSGGACLAGTCTACVSGTACTPSNRCDSGTLSCADPTATPPSTSACTDTAIPAVTCPTGQTCNPATGVCG